MSACHVRILLYDLAQLLQDLQSCSAGIDTLVMAPVDYNLFCYGGSNSGFIDYP